MFLQTLGGTSGMKNGGEATSRFHVTRIQELRNMVGWNHPGPRVVECNAMIFYLNVFSGSDYRLGLYGNDERKGRGLFYTIFIPLLHSNLYLL